MTIMANEQGIVIRLGNGTAWVKTTRSSSCEGCSAKGSCTSVGDDMEVRAINAAGAGVGDRIVLTFDTSPLLKATFLLYVFPILILIAGAAAGQYLSGVIGLDVSVGAALLGFSCFFAAVLFVRKKGNRLAGRQEYQPRISRILNRA